MIKAKKDKVRIKAKDFGQMMTEYIIITKSVKNCLVKECEMSEEGAWKEIDRAVNIAKTDSPIDIVKLFLDELCEEFCSEGEEEDE